VCHCTEYTDAGERDSDEDADADKAEQSEDEGADHIVFEEEQRVSGGESDPGSDTGSEPESEEQPWFLPDGYEVCVCLCATCVCVHVCARMCVHWSRACLWWSVSVGAGFVVWSAGASI